MHHILKALKILPTTVVPKTFKELEAYSEREERHDDSEYEHAHHVLVEVEKHPCFWCGKTKDEVMAEVNTFETDHWAEQSLWHKFDQSFVYKDLQNLDFHGHAKDLPDNPNDLHPLIISLT